MQTYNVVIAFYDGVTHGVMTRRIKDHEDLNRHVPVEAPHYRKLYSVLDENNGVALLVNQLDYTTFMKFSISAAFGKINGHKIVTLLAASAESEHVRGLNELAEFLNELGIPTTVRAHA